MIYLKIGTLKKTSQGSSEIQKAGNRTCQSYNSWRTKSCVVIDNFEGNNISTD